jgi:hypothetical protein
MGRKKIPFEDRWAKKVIRRGDDECWGWSGSKYQHPITKEPTYGAISINGKRTSAHRAVWMHLHGEIPEGMVVMHSCDNPECTNPKHLFLGTYSDNMQDMTNKGRHPGKFRYGEQTCSAKLNNEKAMEIRRLVAEGMTHRAAGELFGVSSVTVTNIVNNKHWKIETIEREMMQGKLDNYVRRQR